VVIKGWALHRALVVATCTCACMAGTGDTRTLPDCCDPAGRFRSRLCGCLAGSQWWEAGGEQAGKRTGDKASGTDRGCGEAQALCEGFACLSLAASKSSSVELVLLYRTITASR
jgi:hypothetical protein